MRVLVCGGRNYLDRNAVFAALDALHDKCGVSVVIHGAARGADTLAGDWAKAMVAKGVRVDVLRYPADWGMGNAAGPIRNRLMLTEGKPDGVVAFPGGRGTEDMIRAAKAAGLKVWQPFGHQSGSTPEIAQKA